MLVEMMMTGKGRKEQEASNTTLLLLARSAAGRRAEWSGGLAPRSSHATVWGLRTLEID